MRTFKYIECIIAKLDVVIAIFGLILGISLLFLYLKSPTMIILIMSIALLTTSPIYLYIRLRKAEYLTTSEQIYFDETSYYSNRTKAVSSILFWILTSAALGILLTNSDTRSPIYFILTAMSTGTIVISILTSIKKLDIIFSIIKIAILSMQVRLSVFLFYGGAGSDYWAHLRMNEILAQSGDIVILTGKEGSYPIMHTIVAIMGNVASMPIKDASGASILLPMVISCICVYLFARMFFGERVGLISALIVSVCDYPIMWSFSPQTTSFGICLFYFSILLMGKIWSEEIRKGKMGHIWNCLFLFMAGTLLITHAVSSYVMLITLFAFATSGVIYSFIHGEKIRGDINTIYFIVYSILLILVSMCAAYGENTKFLDTVAGFLIDSLKSGNAQFLNRIDGSLSSMQLSASTTSQFIDYAPYLIIMLSCIFILYIWMRPGNKQKITYNIMAAFILLQFITYVFPLMGLRNIMPTRWFAFMYFFFSIMMGMCYVFLTFKGNNLFSKILPIIVIIFSLIMISGSVANEDSPLDLNAAKYRVSTTNTFSELQAGETITSYATGMMISDLRYSGIVTRLLGYEEVSIISEKTNKPTLNNILIWREYLDERPIEYTMDIGYYRETRVPKVMGVEYGEGLVIYSLIYSIGSVKAYWV